MKNTRILALVMAVLMVAALFAGCANTEDPSDTTAATTTAATTTEATTTEATTTEATTTEATTTEATTTEATTTEATTTEAPKTDLGGYEFKVQVGYGYESYMPTQDNEIGNEWAEAIENIQDEYNFTLNIALGLADAGTIATWIMSAEFPFDVQEGCTSDIFPWAMKGAIQNLASDEMLGYGLDIYSPEQFYQPRTMMSALKGGVWGMIFASKFCTPKYGFCIMFNKELCESVGYPADKMYQMVRDHEWNFTNYKDLCSKLIKDTDGDSHPNIWATGGGYNPFGAEVVIAGGKAFTEIDGKLTFTMDSPEAMNGLEFMVNEFQDAGWRRVSSDGDRSAGEDREAFAAGEVGLLWAASHYPTDETIRGAEIDYGIIPMPVADYMEDYADSCNGPDVLFMFKGVQNKETVTKALLAWASVLNDPENWKEQYLQDFCRGDEESFEMLRDYILPKLTDGDFRLSTDLTTLIETECEDKIYYKQISAAGGVEAVKAKAQELIDEMLGQ